MPLLPSDSNNRLSSAASHGSHGDDSASGGAGGAEDLSVSRQLSYDAGERYSDASNGGQQQQDSQHAADDRR